MSIVNSDHKYFDEVTVDEKKSNVVDSIVAELEPAPHFATWLYHAKLQRESEDLAIMATSEKGQQTLTNSTEADSQETIDRMQARRAIRTATAFSAFFLITTDILGPTSAPYAFAQLGFFSGSLLYTVLGAVAAYTGILLWKMYLNLDSDRYPIKTFGHLAFAIMGKHAQLISNILQSIQLIFNVAIITLGNGQGLSQVLDKYNVCFSALMIIWMVVGYIVGSIKSLKNFTHIANSAVIMNMLVIFITMGAVAHSPPNYVAALAQSGLEEGPVVTYALVLQPFAIQVNAGMNIVYAYGGAMIFLEIMSEMRRPRDFIKGMYAAQSLIYIAYLIFGIVVYKYQGNFVINPANQGISDYGLQTATNILNLVSAMIAAGLYSNIGIKVILSMISEWTGKDLLAPTLRGRIIWQVSALMYWALAFIIASAVPQFSSIVGLVGALCILQFSYTFPPIMYLAYSLQRDALEASPGYDPNNPHPLPSVDGWKNMSWWKRAFPKRWYFKIANALLFLASLSAAALGCYSSITGLIAAFASGVTTSFGCASPVG